MTDQSDFLEELNSTDETPYGVNDSAGMYVINDDDCRDVEWYTYSGQIEFDWDISDGVAPVWDGQVPVESVPVEGAIANRGPYVGLDHGDLTHDIELRAIILNDLKN